MRGPKVARHVPPESNVFRARSSRHATLDRATRDMDRMGAMATTSAPVTQPQTTPQTAVQKLHDAATRVAESFSQGHPLRDLGLALVELVADEVARDLRRATVVQDPPAAAAGAAAAALPAATVTPLPSSASSTPAAPAAVGGATHDGGSTH